MTAPGWYLDPEDQDRERYWNGGSWSPGARVASAETPEFPEDAPTPARRDPPNGLTGAATFLFFVAGIVAVGALVGGIYLATRTTPSGCFDGYCSGTRHPYAMVGICTVAGGLIQATVIGIVSRLCEVTASLRTQLAAASRVEVDVDG